MTTLLKLSRRRLLAGSAAAAALSASGCAASRGPQEVDPTPPPVWPRLTVGGDCARSVTVQWKRQGPGELVLRRSDHQGSERRFDAPQCDAEAEGVIFPLHTVRIDGLEPGQDYEYRVEPDGSWFRFRTAQSGRCRALVFADSQSNDRFRTWARVYRGALRHFPRPDFAANLGDLVDMGSRLSYWADWFEAVTPAIASVPEAPVMGNHECYRKNPGDRQFRPIMPRAYLEAFPVPENGEGDLERWYYAFDCGPVHFIVLNTQWLEAAAFRPRLYERMKLWFLEKGSKTELPWRVVMMHKDILHYQRPGKPWKTRFSQTGRRLMPLFEQTGIDLVLTGHLHTYRRRGFVRNFRHSKDGPYYFVCGVSGNIRHNVEALHELDLYAAPRPETDNFMTLEADAGTLSVRCFLPDGRELDHALLERSPARAAG